MTTDQKAAFWDALVEHRWNLFEFPNIEGGEPWRVVYLVDSDEHHVIGRGKTAAEAITNALEHPEWSAGNV